MDPSACRTSSWPTRTSGGRRLPSGAVAVTLRFPDMLQRWQLSGHRDQVLRIKLDMEPQNWEAPAERRMLARLDVLTPVLVKLGSLDLAALRADVLPFLPSAAEVDRITLVAELLRSAAF